MAALLDDKLERASLRVLAVLLSFARERTPERPVWPGRDRVAELAGVSRSQVSREIGRLEEAGYLRRLSPKGARLRLSLAPTFALLEGAEECATAHTGVTRSAHRSALQRTPYGSNTTEALQEKQHQPPGAGSAAECAKAPGNDNSRTAVRRLFEERGLPLSSQAVTALLSERPGWSGQDWADLTHALTDDQRAGLMGARNPVGWLRVLLRQEGDLLRQEGAGRRERREAGERERQEAERRREEGRRQEQEALTACRVTWEKLGVPAWEIEQRGRPEGDFDERALALREIVNLRLGKLLAEDSTALPGDRRQEVEAAVRAEFAEVDTAAIVERARQEREKAEPAWLVAIGERPTDMDEKTFATKRRAFLERKMELAVAAQREKKAAAEEHAAAEKRAAAQKQGAHKRAEMTEAFTQSITELLEKGRVSALRRELKIVEAERLPVPEELLTAGRAMVAKAEEVLA
jgi:hypothetical protein